MTQHDPNSPAAIDQPAEGLPSPTGDVEAPEEAETIEPFPIRLRRWLARAAVSGLLLSVFLHLLILLITRLITVSYSGADAGGGPGETISFEIVTQADTPAASEELDVTMPSSSELEAPSLDQLDPVEDLTSAIESIDPVGEFESGLERPAGAAGAASNLATGAGPAGAGSGASFFGLEASGRRFCYIIDVSGSMLSSVNEELDRIDVVKRELTRSILALLESGEFSVVLYAGASGWLFDEGRWLDATQRNKLVAEARIDSILLEYDRLSGVGRFGVTRDGTYPSSAIEKAMSLRPRPDAIYLLTDGEFQEGDVPGFARNLNRSELIPIHCLFITDSRTAAGGRVESDLRSIATDSGGSFTTIGGSP